MTTKMEAPLRLYDLEEEYIALADMPMEAEPNSDTYEVTAAMLDELAGVQTEAKLLRLVKVIKQLTAEADMLDLHSTDIARRATSRRNRIKHIKDWARVQMEGHDIPKVKDAYGGISLIASPASVDIYDEVGVPLAFKRATITLPAVDVPSYLLDQTSFQVMKQALGDHIKATGEVIDGVTYVTDRKYVKVS